MPPSEDGARGIYVKNAEKKRPWGKLGPVGKKEKTGEDKSGTKSPQGLTVSECKKKKKLV